MLIHELIGVIMREVPAIAKDKRNQGQGYNFRGVEDIYAAVHPLLAKHGVFSVPCVLEDKSEERQGKSGGTLIYRILKIRYDFYAPDGSCVSATVIGEGMDSGDKASNKAQSVAHKYAIIQLLAIPTEELIDPERDNPEPAPRQATPPVAAPKPEAPELPKIKELIAELKITDEKKREIWDGAKKDGVVDFKAILHKLQDMKLDAMPPISATAPARVAEMFGGIEQAFQNG